MSAQSRSCIKLRVGSIIGILIIGFLLGTFVGFPALLNYLEHHNAEVSWYVSNGERRETVIISRITGITSYEKYTVDFSSGDERVVIESGYVKTVRSGLLTGIEFSGECLCVQEIATTEIKDNTFHRWTLGENGDVIFEINGRSFVDPYEKHQKIFENALLVRNKFKKRYKSLVDATYKKHIEELAAAEAKHKEEDKQEDESSWLEKYK